jgi:hypothetical protein
MKLKEKEIEKICDVIEEYLNSQEMVYFSYIDDSKAKLIDMLDPGNIDQGKLEIEEITAGIHDEIFEKFGEKK